MSSKKALKQVYKEMTFPKGVYLLRNKHNNKIFIGSSMDLDRAWNSLRVQLKSGNHANEALQRDWLTYGEEGFLYEIVEVLKESGEPGADHRKDVKALEQLVMLELAPYGEKGYHKKSN
ncbi:GIY-YIG nuclease family protein [Chitinophaga polysaccharea]|uniref:GIY-YIG nuclease family protein n=1 Tax=Chitinophaga polysaccharea TaxID=1293035 RepID=UPI001455C564|nr:GIY-YIG nuclease family protein [Chitinophaga polysaccharea]NLR60266.1 GIY-YIG nuclease family protein [Chitinophaga polysaccharea]